MKYISILLIAVIFVSCSGQPEEHLSASGTIEATNVTVTAKIGGQILMLLADEGTTVTKGDTLAALDQSDFQIQLRQALANADVAESQYELTLKGTREEDLLQARANHESARRDLERAEELFRAESITRKQLEDMQTRLVVAEQTYEKLKRGPRSEEIRAARGRRDQAMAQVDAIKKKINDSFVVAPISGIITQRALEEGDQVLPHGALFRISKLEQMHLMIYVAEKELAKVKLNQSALVSIDGYPDKTFAGRVSYISDIAEFTPKNVQTRDDRTKLVFGVKIEIANNEGSLKPGMPADATIKFSSAS